MYNICLQMKTKNVIFNSQKLKLKFLPFYTVNFFIFKMVWTNIVMYVFLFA